MKLRYLGTGADDWIPEEGPRAGEYRRKSAAVLDSVLLIDLAPGTPLDLLPYVKEILYTHSHNDHFDLPTMCGLSAGRTLTVYLENHFAHRIRDRIPENVRLHGMKPGDTVETEEGYRITALAANHRIRQHPEETPLHYVIERGDKRLFWGADGAWLLSDTWARLRAFPPFDRMVLDGTLGEAEGDPRVFEHNHLGMVREMVKVFRRAGLLKSTGQVWLTHISRDSQAPTDSLRAYLAPEDIRVAMDEEEDEF